MKIGNTLEYQYSISDHQGNTRVVFSAVTPAPEEIFLNFEAATNDQVENYPTTSAGRPALEEFDHTDPAPPAGVATRSQLLNGTAGYQVGNC